MRITIIFIAILTVFGLFVAYEKISSGSSNQQTIAYSAQIKSDNGQLIDVREPSEYEAGHADGAINVPLGNILNDDFSAIDKTRPVYVYCRTGNRAGQAKVALEKAGYKNITNIGGLSNWQDQGGLACAHTTPSCQSN